MQRKKFYTICLVLISIISIGQDIIVKKDSSRIEVKLLETNRSEIKYKLFSYQDGPNIIISRKDVAYIIYKNGLPERNLVQAKKDSLVKTFKIGNYIKFNVQLGCMVNNNYCNNSREKDVEDKTQSSGYYPHHGNKYNSSINFGFNFLFGRSPYIQHVIGINYLRSSGEYGYRYRLNNHLENFIYNSKIDFLNFSSGPRVILFKKLTIEPLLSINLPVNRDIKRTGTIVYLNNIPLSPDVESYKDQSVKPIETSGSLAFTPRISYQYTIKQQKFEIYISYNLAMSMRLPWYMAGITYYPLKKLK